MTHPGPAPDPVPEPGSQAREASGGQSPAQAARPQYLAALAGLAVLVLVALLATIYRHLG